MDAAACARCDSDGVEALRLRLRATQRMDLSLAVIDESISQKQAPATGSPPQAPRPTTIEQPRSRSTPMAFVVLALASLPLVVSVVGWLAILPAFGGTLLVALRQVTGRSVVFNDHFAPAAMWWPLLRLSTLVLLPALVGAVLVLPALLVLYSAQLAPFFVLDRGVGAVAALRASWAVVSANPERCALAFAQCLGYLLLGALSLVGWPWLWPAALAVLARTYRDTVGVTRAVDRFA